MSYVSDALSRITSQFEQSPKVLALLSAIIGPLDSLQATSDSVKTERWIDTAIGAQLDGCGYIVGETRQGRDDDTYREAILFRVFVNVSKGTPKDVSYALKYITKSDDVQYIESWPATVMLYCNGYSANAFLPDVMQDLLPAALSDVDIAVSYGEESLRLSNVDQIIDDQSELAGMTASVLQCLDGRRLVTINGKNIRLRTGYKIHMTKPTLAGLFEKR